MSQPLLSIIITVLNGEATLDRCLESLVDQTFTNYEVVVIDGGSVDLTTMILHQYQLSLPLTWQVVPQVGLYAGMNCGIEQANGEWLYFMGCDDELFDSDTLLSVSRYLTNTPAQFITGSVVYPSKGLIIPALCGSPYVQHWAIHHQGTLYRRSLFTSFRYDVSFKISADYDLNLRLAIDRVPYQRIDDIIAIYGESGISSREPKLCFAEVNQIHASVFRLPIRWWIQGLCLIQQRSWFWRKKWGLVNLKHRLRQWLWAMLFRQTTSASNEIHQLNRNR